ncbi:MAG: hypothetical protein M0Z77_04790 [Thermoplasmatales archaeon]|nr:hypothetical protein [Thermoplasmatales archaeon]
MSVGRKGINDFMWHRYPLEDASDGGTERQEKGSVKGADRQQQEWIQ